MHTHRHLALVVSHSLALVLSIACVPSLSRADGPNLEEDLAIKEKTLSLYFDGEFKVNDADPEADIPTIEQRNANPLDFGYFLQTLTEKAEIALRRNEPAQALKYYLALARAVPEGGVSYRRICSTYELMGKLEQAQKSCLAVLDREGANAADYTKYVRLVLTQPGPLSAGQRSDLNEVLAHLKTQDAVSTLAADLECQVAMRLQDKTRLADCTSKLRSSGVKGTQMVSYAWTLAMLMGRYDEASQQIDRGREVGLDAAMLQQMEQLTADKQQPWRPYLRNVPPLGRAALLAAMLILAVGLALRWRRRAQV